MKRTFVIIVLALLSTGCATSGSVRRLGNDLVALRAELAALRQAQEQAGRETANAAGELRALEARVNELSASLTAATSEVGQIQARLEAVDGAVEQARAAVDALPPTPLPSAPPRDSVTAGAETAYAAALTTLRAGEYGQAVLDFFDFIARYPKHSLASNAQFWIGEAYYVQHDYRQALIELQKVLDSFPASLKAPDALLRIGQCQASLKEPARARATWTRLVREFPGSESAGRARALLGLPQAGKGG